MASVVEAIEQEFEAARAECAEARAAVNKALEPLRDPFLTPEQAAALDAAEAVERARSRKFEAVFLVWRRVRWLGSRS